MERTMPTKPKTSIEARVNAAKQAFTNAKQPEILALLTPKGYSLDRLNSLIVQANAVSAARSEQANQRGQSRQSTHQQLTHWREVESAYQELATTIRTIFLRRPDLQEALGTNRTLPQDTAGFLQAATQLFSNALVLAEPDKTALSQAGFPESAINGAYQKLLAFEAAERAQERQKGTAMSATHEKDIELAQLEEEFRIFRRLAKLALKDHPEHLKALGL